MIKLQSLIEKADEKVLKPEDKKYALGEVKIIAKVGQNFNPNEEQKGLIKKSIRFFKGLISELPPASKLSTELVKLITAISILFN